MEEKEYRIKLSQLKELCSTKNQDRKFELYGDILQCPYFEKSAGAVISGGIVKGAGKCFTAAVDVIDRLSEPPKKGSGKL